MFVPPKLRDTVSPNGSRDEASVIAAKQGLNALGFYKPAHGGITGFPDRGMMEGIRLYQQKKGLFVDGVMEPDGPTERSVRVDLMKKQGLMPERPETSFPLRGSMTRKDVTAPGDAAVVDGVLKGLGYMHATSPGPADRARAMDRASLKTLNRSFDGMTYGSPIHTRLAEQLAAKQVENELAAPDGSIDATRRRAGPDPHTIARKAVFRPGEERPADARVVTSVSDASGAVGSRDRGKDKMPVIDTARAAATFDRYRERLRPREGGIADRPKNEDRGGTTNQGISQDTLDDLRIRNEWKHLPASTRDLTDTQITTIYRDEYYDYPRIAAVEQVPGMRQMAPELPEQLFDISVLHGWPTMNMLLARALRDVAGIDLNIERIGVQTVVALANVIDKDVVVALNNRIVDLRQAYMRRLKNYQANRNGWESRAESFRIVGEEL